MNNLLARELVCASNLSVAGVTAVQSFTFLYQLGSCGAVDGAVHTATTQQGLIGRVDDRIHLETSNVGADERDFVIEGRGRSVDGGFGGLETAELVQDRERGDLGQSDLRHLRETRDEWHAAAEGTEARLIASRQRWWVFEVLASDMGVASVLDSFHCEICVG